MKHLQRNPILLVLAIISFLLQSCSIDTEQNLAGYYPFNSNADDESSYDFNGTVIGAKLSADRFNQENKAFKFNGRNSYIKINDAPELKISPQKTISVWIYFPERRNKYQAIIEKGSTNEGWEYGIYINQNDKVRFVIYPYSGISEYCSITSFETLKTNTWYHLVAVFNDDSKISLYINGKIDNYSQDFHKQYDYSEGTAYLTIGIRKGWGSHADPTYQFKGIIDDVKLYNRILSEKEITKLYDEAK